MIQPAEWACEIQANLHRENLTGDAAAWFIESMVRRIQADAIKDAHESYRIRFVLNTGKNTLLRRRTLKSKAKSLNQPTD